MATLKQQRERQQRQRAAEQRVYACLLAGNPIPGQIVLGDGSDEGQYYDIIRLSYAPTHKWTGGCVVWHGGRAVLVTPSTDGAAETIRAAANEYAFALAQ